MFVAGLLLAAAGAAEFGPSGSLPVQGNLDVTLRQAVYAAWADTTDDQAPGQELEISYDIPHTALSFLRTDSGFSAAFRVGVDLLDARKNPVASDFREQRISVAGYEETIDRFASIGGALTMPIPPGARNVQLKVQDLGSERRASAGFRLAEGAVGIRLQFIRRGQLNPTRVYESSESLDVRATVLDRSRPDSIRFAVRDNRRVLLSRAVAVADSAGRVSARLVEPLDDSSGAARFPGGEYLLEATGVGGSLLPATGHRLQAQAGFRFKVPFFYDEQAWRDKVDRLLWAATAEELRELRARPPEEREQAWRDFWRDQDPTGPAGAAEREEKYFERIAYAEEHFSRGDRGYRSDRARVYVRLGPPDLREIRPFELDSHALEVWSYYSLGLRFVFVDRYGFGEYVLDGPRSVP